MTAVDSVRVNVLVLYPGCVFLEVAEALSMLRGAGNLAVATADGCSVRTEEGFTVEADTTFADVMNRNIQSLIIPGGDCHGVFQNQDLANLIKTSAAEGVVIGGICNGALLLAKAGILSGRRCTHTCTPKYAPVPEFQELLDAATPVFADALYVDEDVVRDELIVTAKPWATKAFAEELVSLVGARDVR